MANLKGLESVVSQLRIQRTNLVNNLKRVDGALSALGSLNGARTHAEPRRTQQGCLNQRSRCSFEVNMFPFSVQRLSRDIGDTSPSNSPRSASG